MPPRTNSQMHENVSVADVSEASIDSSIPDVSGIDFEALFHCNSEYITLETHLKQLENQLSTAQRDIEQLKKLKTDALSDPKNFVALLKRKSSRESFPSLQRIFKVPDIDLNRFNVRLTRRANSRFEQNLDYLVSRAQNVHIRQPALTPPQPSSEVSVFDGFVRVEGKRAFSDIRNGFISELPYPENIGPRSVSPANEKSFRKIEDLDLFINPHPLVVSSTSLATIHQPKPRQASRFTATGEEFIDLPNETAPISRPSSTVIPAISTPISLPSTSKSVTPISKGRVRKFSALPPESTSITHNIPWSDDEKRKLDYLLTVYPEEDVQARRYAKISAALGSRTANQVASRVQKLAAKAQRVKDRVPSHSVGSLSTSSTDSDLVVELEKYFKSSNDPNIKSTLEYEEYTRLKEQLEAIAKNPLNGVLHLGYKCDCCGIEPIIGPRWTCTSCPKDRPTIDLCDVCVSRGFETDIHRNCHVMKKIEIPEDMSESG